MQHTFQELQFAPHTELNIRNRLAQIAIANPPCLYFRDGEAMGICWNNIEWHSHKGVRYSQIWVSGKQASAG